MTPQEFRQKVADSGVAELLTSTVKEIKIPYLKEKIEYNIPALFEYVHRQCEGWQKLSNLPQEFINSKTFFQSIKTALEELVNKNAANVTNGLSRLDNALHITHGQYIFPYDSIEADFLISIYSNSDTRPYFLGAFAYIVKKSINMDYNSFTGAILAYEFCQKDISQITQRKKAEKRTLTLFKGSATESIAALQSEAIRAITESEDKFKEYVKKIDELKTQKINEFDTWLDKMKSSHEGFHSECTNHVSELEETYKEKLKLEAPAKYWEERAAELKKQGWKAFGGLFALIVLSAVSLFTLLVIMPTVLWETFFNGDIGIAIKWTIGYATFIAFLAYGIKAVSKVMFSSFHLARDCEERKTLTYFYLTLIKDSEVSAQDRQLIMQSLFSRAETGLLKDDSSPTMPTEKIVSTFMESTKGK